MVKPLSTWWACQLIDKITRATTYGELLEVVSQDARASGASSGSLLYVEDQSALSVMAAWSTEPLTPPVGNIIPCPTINLDTPLMVADVEKTDHSIVDFIHEHHTQRPIRAYVLLPLHNADRLVGLLSFGWSQPHEFTSQEHS